VILQVCRPSQTPHIPIVSSDCPRARKQKVLRDTETPAVGVAGAVAPAWRSKRVHLGGAGSPRAPQRTPVFGARSLAAGGPKRGGKPPARVPPDRTGGDGPGQRTGPSPLDE